MSDDPLIQRLTRLTPIGSGLDRDALLFAAGRASARPHRVWPALAGALAVSQLLTLGLLFWPRDVVPVPGLPKEAAPVVGVAPPLPPIPEGTGAWVLRERFIAAEGNLPLPGATELAAPSADRLRAFGALPPDLLH